MGQTLSNDDGWNLLSHTYRLHRYHSCPNRVSQAWGNHQFQIRQRAVQHLRLQSHYPYASSQNGEDDKVMCLLLRRPNVIVLSSYLKLRYLRPGGKIASVSVKPSAPIVLFSTLMYSKSGHAVASNASARRWKLCICIKAIHASGKKIQSHDMFLIREGRPKRRIIHTNEHKRLPRRLI